MLSLYSGTPGSYKSYHAVAEVISWLRLGRNVICNFPVDYKHVIKRKIKGEYQFLLDDQITVDYLIDYAKTHHKKSVHAQTLVVIDEASLKFNPRDFGRKDRMTWINFLANHRHFNFEFILITQTDRMLDRQIRGLIETEYKHRAIKNINTLCWFIDKIFRGCYMIIEYWYPCRFRVKAEFGIFHKRIADCYDTMALFVGSHASSEVKESQKSTKPKIPRIKRLGKEAKTIVQIDDPVTKKQVSEDLSKFINVLSDYIRVCDEADCGSGSRN